MDFEMDFENDITAHTVARRIVMRRETWEQLERLAEALRETRDLDVSAAEVARIALESGLAEVQDGLSASGRQRRKKTTPAKAGSGRARRPTAPLTLSADERAELDALLGQQRSVRGRQRTIALWLGHVHKKKVALEWLRQLAIEYDAYDVANFAQNMKKDGGLFSEQRTTDGGRAGWRLTADGQQAIDAALAAVLADATL